MRISLVNGKLHEMLLSAKPGEMITRAISHGCNPADVEEKEITWDEYNLYDPMPSMLEVAQAKARLDRDQRISAIQWRRDRHYDELALGLTLTEPIEPVLAYIQALRDVPDQPGFPDNITWPEEP